MWLAEALLGVARSGQVVAELKSVHGQKYVVDGRLSSHTETSRQRMVRTVWVIDDETDAPRLVTAYPGRE
ncbi:MAG: hypothetical protein Q7R30_20455 [Acidobacteriota bacterium]|nr:hypothetical protein [Acidobacteriota bacterium]